MFGSSHSAGKRKASSRSESGSQVGSSGKKVHTTPQRPPTPPPPPPEPSSEERVNTPESDSDDSELSDDTRSLLFDEPPRTPSIVQTVPVVQEEINMPSEGRPKVNPPDVFTGEPTKLKAFLSQCRMYFFLNAKEFDTEDKKTLFMVTYMRDRAYKMFEERASTYLGDPTGCSQDIRRLFGRVTNFENELNLVFGNADEKRAADRELHRVKQTHSAQSYAAEFQRISASLDWNDDSLRSQFFSGLKQEVRAELLRKETNPANLAALIREAIKVDQIIYEIGLEKRGQGPKQRNFKANDSQPRRSQAYYGPQPMEIDKLQKGNRFQKKTQGSGKGQRAQKGNCYNCGKPGHFANKCRQPKKEKTFQGQPQSIRVLQREEAQQIQVLGTPGDENLDWGINQRGLRNGAAAQRILREDNAACYHPRHRLHWVLPANWCLADDCDIWEHRDAKDPGEQDWIYRDGDPTISYTQVRRVLRIEGIREKHDHVHHRHIPANYCTSFDCTLESHQPMLLTKVQENDKLKYPRTIRWDTLERERSHREIPWHECNRMHCPNHRELADEELERGLVIPKPSPYPTPGTQTPSESEDSNAEDFSNNYYFQEIRKAVDELIGAVNNGEKQVIVWNVPDRHYDIRLAYQADPHDENPKKSFNLSLKVVHRDVPDSGTEHEDEESDEDTSDDRADHDQYDSGNEGGSC